MKRIACLLFLAALVGCKHQPKSEFITTSNGLVYRANKETGEIVLVAGKPDVAELVPTSNGLLYRIDKQSGDLSLIVGTQVTKLEEPEVKKGDDNKRRHVMTWPDRQNKQLGDLNLKLKTNWRDGKLYYNFQVSPYAGRIEREFQKSGSNARFLLRFYDQDGFETFVLPIQLSEMVKEVDDTGKIDVVTMNTTTTCDLQTYEALKLWMVGWGGFQETQ
jgi:hypothetical protein